MTEAQINLFPALAPPIEGLLGTFVQAKAEPVHSWFPYLEGYSSTFVSGLLDRFLPNATRVIDPFAGTGTTAVTLAQRGVLTGYCETNPVMRFVVRVKAAALALAGPQRRATAAALERLAASLSARVARSNPNEELLESYSRCFNASTFFDDARMEKTLRLRTVCDEVSLESPELCDYLTLAVVGRIVEWSLLKRAGDLRYRTPKELAKGLLDPLEAVRTHLQMIARDLARNPGSTVSPALLCEDAKDLKSIPAFLADGVITSPPYLNGTNYIRNARLELWFMREIRQGADLRKLRDRMITAGINDVSGETSATSVSPDVQRVVDEVAAGAYDQRIPLMVSAYFADMQTVLEGLARQTQKDAVVCIDIGDSRYGGVHVPTQGLLCTLAEAAGFRSIEQVRLRTRIAKDRTRLSQDVLVFARRAEVSRPARSGKVDRDARERWFRDELPHTKAPYTSRNWGHSLHSACSYQGKMKPGLAHFLVHSFTEEGQSVLDPFSGAGTIPFEAALQGRVPVAMDISSMAFAVTSAKVRPADPARLRSLLARLEKAIERRVAAVESEAAAKVRFNRPIPEYFHADTLAELLSARRFLLDKRDDSAEWCLVMTCLMHVLHGNRPYALSRRSHPVTPFAPTGPTEYKSVIEKLKAKIERCTSAELPAGFRSGTVYQADLCEPWPKEIGEVDAVITSPPFFDSTRFYMSNWMRFWLCGWEREDFDIRSAQYVETLQKKSLDVYVQIFARLREHIRSSGVVVLHLGHSKKCNMAVELVSRSEKYFHVRDVYSEDVTKCESHGVSDKGTVHDHQFVVLRPR